MLAGNKSQSHSKSPSRLQQEHFEGSALLTADSASYIASSRAAALQVETWPAVLPEGFMKLVDILAPPYNKAACSKQVSMEAEGMYYTCIIHPLWYSQPVEQGKCIPPGFE